jgi:actin-related protein 9
MFPAQQEGEWEPYKVRQRKKSQAPVPQPDGAPAQDDEPEYFEDFTTDEGAVWPMAQGRIVNWSCFFALLTYVHKRMSPHLHSPILLVAQPCWTASDYEKLTQFFFEKFKPPGFTIVDAALPSLWAYNVVNACVVDVGYEKTDVTAISDFSINVSGRGISIPNCGGESFTQQLLRLLKPRNFNRIMCEQLKTSAICEIPPPGTTLPGFSESPVAATHPVLTGAPGSGSGQRLSGGALGEAGNEAGDDGKDDIEADGVLDVASIVAGGNKKMEEFLARKEKEKAEKGAKKKHGDAAAQALKAGKLRNIDRERATFVFEELKYLEPADKPKTQNGTGPEDIEMSNEDGQDQPPATPVQTHSTAPSRVRKELEVGTERFQADAGIIDRIADAIYLAVSSVDDMSKRSEIWDSLIVVGNGAKIKGNPDDLTRRSNALQASERLSWPFSRKNTSYPPHRRRYSHPSCRRISPRPRERGPTLPSRRWLLRTTTDRAAASIRCWWRR